MADGASITLDLPWPDKRLNDNSRTHWAQKARVKSEARSNAFWLGKDAKVKPWPDATLQFYFYPPDNRRRDAQNMPGMMKAYIDGIADAMGCDDHAFQCEFPSKFEAVSKAGLVKVIIREGGE